MEHPGSNRKVKHFIKRSLTDIIIRLFTMLRQVRVVVQIYCMKDNAILLGTTEKVRQNSSCSGGLREVDKQGIG